MFIIACGNRKKIEYGRNTKTTTSFLYLIYKHLIEGTKPRVRVDCTTEGVTAGKELSVKYEKMSKSKHNGVDPVKVLEQVRKGIGVRDEVIEEQTRVLVVNTDLHHSVLCNLLHSYCERNDCCNVASFTSCILNHSPSLLRMVSISLDCNCWTLLPPEHQSIGENLVRWRGILWGYDRDRRGMPFNLMINRLQIRVESSDGWTE